MLVLVFIGATTVAVGSGCKSHGDALVSAPLGAPASSSSASGSTAASPTVNGVTGELQLAREVSFEVRPLNGPGSMGPRVLSKASELALEEVSAYLAAHPEARPVRIECAANPFTMSGMPTPRWPAGLAHQVARWLVDHGTDCARLEVVGRLDRSRDAPGERVRFFVGRSAPREGDAYAQLDACTVSDAP